ncbi:MAG TPA: polyprenyl synthetase family protein [Firmicutes bacterium]|nr:polyprenyl synthetase family protein [Bacillota bacterium]
MKTFWKDKPEMVSRLNEINKIIESELSSKQKKMNLILKELTESGGKMVRPGLCVIGGQFGDKEIKNVYHLGAIVEMLHIATLVHDDIIDDSHHRRGQLTTQSKYGKDYAVYTGDFIFTKCFEVLATHYDVHHMKELSRAISRICMGEIEQFDNRYKYHTSVKRYLKIIGAKTSALLAMSLSVGAHEAGCDEKFCKSLAKIGYHLGNAFQMIDDILDYNGNQELVGKTLGNDIRQGYYTLPLIYALREKDKKLEILLNQKEYNDEVVLAIIERVNEIGGVDAARDLAHKYTKKALKEIKALPDGEAKENLIWLVHQLLDRHY